MALKRLFWLSAISSMVLASEIGHVIGTTGNWCDAAQSDCSGQRPALLSPLTVVKSDSRITRVGKLDNGDRLRIRSYASGLEVIFACKVPLDCQSPIDLKRIGAPEGADDRSGLGAFFRVLRKMSSDQPQVWIAYSHGILTSRGQDGPSLDDAVLELKSNYADLAPMFANLPQKKYVARVCVVRLDGLVTCPSSRGDARRGDASFYCGEGVLDVQWDPQAPTTVRYNNAGAGMIRVSLCDEQGMVTDRNAVALIATPEHFRVAASQFEEARQVARALKSTEADPTIESTVRMFLHHIAFQ